LFRESRGYAQYSNPRHGGAHLPPSTAVSGADGVEVSSHWLWSLGCWLYLHPNRGHSGILMPLQQSNPIFSMAVEVMKPAFNLEPKCRVTMLTREDWTIGTSDPRKLKG
jgi:hypothetical protein